MRLILDSNIWSYLGAQDAGANFERLAADRGWTILTPPASLIEALQGEDAEKRNRTIALLASSRWKRMATEIDVECQEFIKEVKLARPGWVRQVPQPGRPAQLRNYWMKRIWREASRNSSEMAARGATLESEVKEVAYKALDVNRASARESKFRTEDLSKIMSVPLDDAPAAYLAGWEPGVPVEAWRVENRDVYRFALANRTLDRMRGADTTILDWLEPYLWIDNVARDWVDFTRFWFNDALRERMPRCWVRWAINVAQMMFKIGQGSPRDGQLAPYLLDCDVFVTEDKRFALALDLVKESCPAPFADVRRVHVGGEGERVLDVLADLP